MNIFNRTNQGGVTVLGFIIVGVVLALVTIGVVYALYQRGDQARRDQAIAVVEDQEQAADESLPPPDDTTSRQPTADANPAAGYTPSQTELPATGPADDIHAAFVLAILTASITAYAMSRRTVRVTL
jgi:cbb3-type cytochrome oxidase subunit 3